MVARLFRDWLGGNESYEQFRVELNQYFALGRHSSIGARVEGETIGGEAPFFAYPFVKLRGIPAMRYQGETVVSTEIEVLWGFTPRWSLVGFGGVGHATAASDDDSEFAPAGGTGFRYRMAREFGLQGGLDFAWGPEKFAFYVTIGSAW